jgi:hypothetical protein
MISFLHLRLVNAYSINPKINLFLLGNVCSWEDVAPVLASKRRIMRKSSAGTSRVEEISKIVPHPEGLAIYRDRPSRIWWTRCV